MMDCHPANQNNNFEVNENDGEMGLIESVAVKNFMCHDNLKLAFSPRVNYVLGRNGSGKSAILTSLMVALGSKASSTGRGNSIKSVIKKGKQNAEVSVTLRNLGSDAFQPHVYGDRITVERKLTIDGGSHYKIKNNKGQIVSTKREDLFLILQAYNIQVDNPIAILTQEISRNFLNSKNAEDKYTFFFKATQLEQLEEEYRKTDQRRKMAQSALQGKQDTLPQLKQEIDVLAKKMRERESLEQQKIKLRELENEFSWALVIEKEMIALKWQARKQRSEASLQEKQERLKMIEERLNDLLGKENGIQDAVIAIEGEVQSLSAKRSRLNNQRAELNDQARESKSNVHKFGKDITVLEKEIGMLKRDIVAVQLRSKEDLKNQEEERVQKINKHLKNRETLIERSNALQGKVKKLQAALEDKKHNSQNKNDVCRAMSYKIQALEKEIDQMKQYKKNSVMAYGFDMPRLIERVDKLDHEGAFVRKPIGPVGLKVKLKDKKWALAVERCFGVSLRGFLCDGKADADKLQEVIQELNIQRPPPVTCCKFIYQVYDVRKNEVRSLEFPSVLEMLCDTDPVVLNHLIDQRGIENIILIESNPEARRVMMSTSRVPAKCHEAFTLSGNNVCPAPNFAFYSNSKKQSTLLSSSAYSQEKIQMKDKELVELKRSLAQEVNIANCLKKDIELQRGLIQTKEGELSKLQGQIVREDAEIKELENLDETNDTTFLAEDLKKAKNQLETVEIKKQKEESLIHTLSIELSKVDECLNEVNAKLEIKCDEKSNLMRSLLRSSANSSMNVRREKEQQEKDCNESLKSFQEIEKIYLGAVKAANDMSVLALSVGPRVSTKRSPLVLQNLIEQRKELLNRNDGFGCLEEVTLLFNAKNTEYERTEQEINQIDNHLKILRKLMKHRFDTFQKIEAYISLRVKYLFTANLDCQGFAGKLVLDHKNRTLNIFVQPTTKGRRVGKTISNVKNLSGGERSFTTIALMLSLWNAVEIPFRILDEYDVFMDQVNRKRSMDLMLSTALEQKANQFIFLSPLDLADSECSSSIHILNMPDPIRCSNSQQAGSD